MRMILNSLLAKVEPNTAVPTPIERRGNVWVKRDDLAERLGFYGSKARTADAVMQNLKKHGHKGAVVAVSRNSSIPAVIANAAKYHGLQAVIHTAYANEDWTEDAQNELKVAESLGAKVIAHKPGYLNVITSRAKADASARGYKLLPLGMEGEEAVLTNAAQSATFPADMISKVNRIVVPTGSGVTLAGIVLGLKKIGCDLPILAVAVGADPIPTMKYWGIDMNSKQIQVVKASKPLMHRSKQTNFHGLELDHTYEAKCVEFLQDDDLFWVIALRSTQGRPTEVVG